MSKLLYPDLYPITAHAIIPPKSLENPVSLRRESLIMARTIATTATTSGNSGNSDETNVFGSGFVLDCGSEIVVYRYILFVCINEMK